MTSTDLSGLLASTTYYFKVNTVEYSITTGGSQPTYAEVVDLMNAEIVGAGFRAILVGTAPNEDIRVYNDAVRGSGSETILDFGTTGNDLFANLTGFTAFELAVSGSSLGPIEVEPELDLIPANLSGTSPFTITVGPEVGGITIIGSTITADTIDITFDLVAGTATFGGDASTGQIDYAYEASGTASFNEIDNVAEYTVEFEIESTGSVAFNEVDDVSEYTVEFEIEATGSASFGGAATTEQQWEPTVYGTDSYYGDVVYES